MSKRFPINVFPDVERNSFNKYTKKNVTEDYIYENLKLQGWTCYKPFVDTGIDLIATKLNENGEMIYRYIQIKTRELSYDKKFGYTLKPKDFRTDPRHFFLFFCDTIDEIILISMYDYMKIFYTNKEMGITHFANPTFRTDNNKLNSLKYDKNNGWSWTYKSKTGKKTISFNDYVNEKGLQKMNDSFIDNNLEEIIKEITKMKFEMFYKLNKTPSNKELFKKELNEEIIKELNSLKECTSTNYIKSIQETESNYKKEYPELYKSHKRYIYGYSTDNEGGNNNE